MKLDSIFDKKALPKKIAEQHIKQIKKFYPKNFEFYFVPIFDGATMGYIYLRGEI